MPNFLTFVGLNLPPNVNITETSVWMFEETSSPAAIIFCFSWFGGISSPRRSVQLNSIKQKDTSFWQDRWKFYAPGLFNNDLWLHSYTQTQQLAINVKTCSMENIIHDSLPFHTHSSLAETLPILVNTMKYMDSTSTSGPQKIIQLYPCFFLRDKQTQALQI